MMRISTDSQQILHRILLDGLDFVDYMCDNVSTSLAELSVRPQARFRVWDFLCANI